MSVMSETKAAAAMRRRTRIEVSKGVAIGVVGMFAMFAGMALLPTDRVDGTVNGDFVVRRQLELQSLSASCPPIAKDAAALRARPDLGDEQVEALRSRVSVIAKAPVKGEVCILPTPVSLPGGSDPTPPFP